MKRKTWIIGGVAILLLIVSLIIAIFLFCNNKKVEVGEYIMNVSLESDMKTVHCSTEMEVSYRGDNNAGELKLLMNSGAFTDKLICEAGELNAAYPKGESYGKVKIDRVSMDDSDCEFNLSGNVLSVRTKDLDNGDRINVAVKYSLVLPYTTLRYGYNEYSTNLAQFYPQYAPVYEYDAIGDPFNSYADNYKTTIEYPKHLKSVASGDLIDRIENGETIVDKYESKNCRDYSIVIARNYNLMSENADGVTINYLYATDKTPETTLKAAINAVKVFSGAFGKYSRKTLQIAETDFLQGGMEFSGLITVTNSSQASERERIVIHEIAHQWWYDAVHSDQIEHAWQDEGLTEFSVYFYYMEIGDTDNANKLIWNAKSNAAVYRNIIAKEGLAADERIDRPTTEFINSYEYTFSVYIKGQLMFNFIYDTLGRDKFINAISEYYENNKFTDMTVVEDLISAFDHEQIGLSLIIRAWLDGKIYSL